MSFRRCLLQVHRRGVCVNSRNPDAWFREEPRGLGALDLQRRHAKEACAQCPVRLECLTVALTYEAEAGVSWGIWGGVCARDRQDAIAHSHGSASNPDMSELAEQITLMTEFAQAA